MKLTRRSVIRTMSSVPLLSAAGHVYIAEYNNTVIRRIHAATGFLTSIAGSVNVGDFRQAGPGFSGDGGDPAQARLFMPRHVSFDPAGNMYINDQGNNRIRRVRLANAGRSR